MFWLGLVCSGAATALLIFTVFKMGSPDAANLTASAVKNANLAQKVLFVSVLGLAVGSSYLFWGSEFLAVGLLAYAALMYFAPLWLPMVTTANSTNDAVSRALGALQEGGVALGLIAVLVVIADVLNRVRERAKHGTKADHIRLGKGIKEESDKQNVFLGKCWQLPYCRKFVRERCPIYHAKVTCWRERTGCMCEEEVIRGAMENKPIPKDQLLAQKMIPRNHKLTDNQKAERCRHCVIYNEHQKHKYRAMLPATLIGFAAAYVLLHGPLIQLLEATVRKINAGVSGVTLNTVGKAYVPAAFTEGLLVVLFLVAISYSLKVLEYAIFKAKV
ncbi:hypothetical protein EON79_04755 [bacterium]|nr:MAG: hypothetical protein EON79_04755 [bacterium]